MTDFSYLNVDNAYKLINQKVTKTPLVTNDYINNLLQAKIYFKLENLQNTGSFKLRGATHKITKLIETVKDSGVVAYSSGNHAQAVAYASMINTISAKIIMPKTAPQIKIENTKKYGAEVILYDTYFQSREEIGNEIQKKDNRALIKPYDDEDIIAGQGTAAIEIVNDLKEQSIEPDLYLCCCGGGGLIAGTSIAIDYLSKSCQVIGAEPSNVDDAYRSLISGKIETNKSTNTIADGLRTNLGSINFPIIQKHVKEILLVSETEIINSLNIILNELKLVVEPSSAVVLAALIKNKEKFKNKKIGLIMCGGNIDFNSLKF